MTPDEARQTLIDALVTVRQRFDEGADDWQHSLLRTYREYSRAIGIDRHLLDPLQKMLFDADNAIHKDRRREAGKPSNTMHLGRAAVWTMAAAAVTVLTKRGEFTSSDAALKDIAVEAGLDLAKFRNFHRNIEAGNYSGEMLDGYDEMKAEITNWPKGETIPAIRGIAKLS